jgi:DNA-binding beta-propeller fold protein YncE
MAERVRFLRTLLALLLVIAAFSPLAACLCPDCVIRDAGGGGTDGSTGDGGPMRPDTGIVPLDAGCMPTPMMTIVCRTPPDAGPMRDGGNLDIPLPTNGSPVGLTKDDAVAVFITHYYGGHNLHLRTGIAKYSIDFTSNTVMENGSYDMLDEAVQSIVGQDDDSAYVAGATQVIKLTGLSRPGTAPMLNSMTPAGSEPRGMALTPSGSLLYVANFSDGTVTVFNTMDMSVNTTVDLNTPLAKSGLLGPSVMNQSPARPALAHPWAIAVTNHGNNKDSEEEVYVTEYFSQARTSSVPNDDSRFDVGRQGILYTFDVATNSVGPLISIAPRLIADPAFVDSNNFTTGCFPNQLNAVTIDNGRLYITALCASPRGPVGPVVDQANGDDSNVQNFKTVVHPAIYVVDLATNQERATESLLLDVVLQHAYDQDSVPDDNTRRMPLSLGDIEFEPGTHNAYVTAYGADALFRIAYNEDGTLNRIGAQTSTTGPTYYIDLATKGTMGKKVAHLPRGLAISRAGHRALVINDHTRNISIVDLDNQQLIQNFDLAMASPTGMEGLINDGHRSFATGLGRWSYRGQAWSSCEACHPNGWSDGVTWFLGTGPRQTPSLDSLFGSMHSNITRFYGWGANADEIHDFELFARRISGGAGAIVHQVSDPPVNADRIDFAGEHPIPPGQQVTGQPNQMQRNDWINGSTSGLMPGSASSTVSAISDWNAIQGYLRVLRGPTAPSNLSAADVANGQNIFLSSNCLACHGGEQWTISRQFYTPSQLVNDPFTGMLLGTYMAAASFPMGLNPVSDGVGRSATLRSPADPHDPSTLQDSQIYCILRAVGTYPTSIDANKDGIAPAGVTIREVRQDMTTTAQGFLGFNPPPLLTLALTPPYFHAGNARTLEEAFSDTFRAHSNAMILMGSPPFPGAGNREVAIRQLVAFLLSIDTTTGISDPPLSLGGFDPLLCPLRLGM